MTTTTVRLTGRELQVAELLAWGMAKKEAADRLGISTHTVENIARSVYEKVGIQKAAELSAWWICTKYGIVRDESPKSPNLLPFHSGGGFRTRTRVVPAVNGTGGRKYRVESVEISYT